MKKLMFILWVLTSICMSPFYNCNAEFAVSFDEKDILREIYIQEDVPVVRTLPPLQDSEGEGGGDNYGILY